MFGRKAQIRCKTSQNLEVVANRTLEGPGQIYGIYTPQSLVEVRLKRGNALRRDSQYTEIEYTRLRPLLASRYGKKYGMAQIPRGQKVHRTLEASQREEGVFHLHRLQSILVHQIRNPATRTSKLGLLVVFNARGYSDQVLTWNIQCLRLSFHLPLFTNPIRHLIGPNVLQESLYKGVEENFISLRRGYYYAE